MTNSLPLPDTFGTPPGNSWRDGLLFMGLGLLYGLAACAAITALHFLIK